MARPASASATSRATGGKRSRAPTRTGDRFTSPNPRPEGDAATLAAAEAVLALPMSALGTEIDPRSLLFDPAWYRETYPDVAAAGLDPIRHFFENGAHEGRRPNPFFDTARYVETYADVAAARMNPFLHYLLYGAREGRQPR